MTRKKTALTKMKKKAVLMRMLAVMLAMTLMEQTKRMMDPSHLTLKRKTRLIMTC